MSLFRRIERQTLRKSILRDILIKMEKYILGQYLLLFKLFCQSGKGRSGGDDRGSMD